VKTISYKVVKHSLAYLSAKMIGGGRPLLRKNSTDTDPAADFLIYFRL